MVGLPEDAAKRYPWQLSGGQRQRVGVARALANEPKVMLMDEPFGALDPLTRAEMQTMLRELLQRTEVTTLIVTHDLDEALYLADRVVLLEGGAIVADLARAEVRESPNEAMRKYVAATHREVRA
jgi:osmoprotectant transport system ATP-binding protein